MGTEKPQDIRERTFEFAGAIIDVAEQLQTSKSNDIIANQLIRSGTSIGANVEEAVAAHSKQDFIYRMGVALREARETRYWLRIIQSRRALTHSLIDPIVKESEEIMNILGAIVSKARGKRK